MSAVPRIGAVIADRYVLCERIGAGGMGVVFRASDPALRRTVAIKLLHARHASNPRFVGRFHAEAIAGGMVQHPCSVLILEDGATADGVPYIVMEDIDGVNLGRVIAHDGLLPLPRAIAIVRQLLAALAEAHASGVVHADVKTDNLLLERTRSGDRVRLIDYGLARLADGEPAEDGAERFEVSGTPEYMAPEVISGGIPTPAADIYGAGVILYELLVGTTPFGGGSAATVMKRHLHDEVVPPSLRHPDRGISTALERIVLRALAKAPSHRFPTAAAFSRALAGIVGTLDRIPVVRVTEDSIASDADRPTRVWTTARDRRATAVTA